jgi:tetratricopeptide (TPR) repeat protein
VVLGAGMLLILLLTGRSLLSAFWSNGGFLAINHHAASSIWHLNAGSELSFFQRATAADPVHSPGWRGLGFARHAEGEMNRAVNAWAQTDAMAAELLAWAQLAERENDVDDALHQYALAGAVAPAWVDPWYFRGRLLTARNSLPEARTSYLRALEGARFDDVRPGDIYYRLGRLVVLEENPDWAAAAELFDRAVRLDDFSTQQLKGQTFYARGDARRRSGDARNARSDFEAALNLLPEHYWARVQLGALVWELDQDAGRAEALWREAIALNPESKWAFRNLGAMYAASGRTAAAVAAFEEVLARDPDDPLAVEQLSRLNSGDEE